MRPRRAGGRACVGLMNLFAVWSRLLPRAGVFGLVNNKASRAVRSWTGGEACGGRRAWQQSSEALALRRAIIVCLVLAFVLERIRAGTNSGTFVVMLLRLRFRESPCEQECNSPPILPPSGYRRAQWKCNKQPPSVVFAVLQSAFCSFSTIIQPNCLAFLQLSQTSLIALCLLPRCPRFGFGAVATERTSALREFVENCSRDISRRRSLVMVWCFRRPILLRW